MPRQEFQCELAFKPEQLFDLAADVESYPRFLPGCIATRIVRRDGEIYYSDQVFGFGAFRKRFHSKTRLQRPDRIIVTSNDRMFRRFELIWHFEPLPAGGCRVRLLVDLEMRSRLAQELFSDAVNRALGSVMSAFESRAIRLYGVPAAQLSDPMGNRSGNPAV